MTTRGPGVRHYVYQPKLAKLGEHEVLVEGGERVIYITSAQAKSFIEDFPMLGVKSWNDLTEAEQEHIHELCGGRIIPHELIAEDIKVGPPLQNDLYVGVLYLFFAKDIEVSPPSMSAQIGQVHTLAALGFDLPSPLIGESAVADVLIDALGFAVGSPVIGTVVITQQHILYAHWVNSVAAPSIGLGTFIIGFTATNVANSSPVLGTPVLGQL